MIMATSVIKQRTIEKFIMSSSLYDYLDSEEAEYVSRTGW